MEGDLHLNEIHSELISDYLRFSKYQLTQRLKSIDYCFTSLLNCRVRSNETYTGDEVKTLLQDLQDVIKGEADTELCDAIHTNALLVKELLMQAEEWHLTLTANISELENREKLAEVKMFDEKHSSDAPKMNITVTQAKQIIPIEDMNFATALKQEIARLTADNDFLRSKLINLEEKSEIDVDVESAKSDTLSKLYADLTEAEAEIDRLKATLASSEKRRKSDIKLQSIQDAVDNLSKELELSKTNTEEQTEKLRKDLEARESKLRQVQSNLLLAEKELDKKFQATAAFMNMKKILIQKNSKIKTLRKKLVSLGGIEGDEEEEEEEASVVEEGFHV